MNKNNIAKFFIIIIIFSFSLNLVFATGISPAKKVFNFYPNSEYDFTFKLYGYSNIEAEVSCPDIIKVNAIEAQEEFHIAYVTLTFPEKMDNPGINKCGIKFLEKTENAHYGIGTKTSVGGQIFINVPYPGKYAEINLLADNVNKGEPILFKASVINKGDEELINVRLPIQILDVNEKLIDIIFTNTDSIVPFQNKEFFSLWGTSDIDSAEYKAYIEFDYGGDKPAIAETKFLVGKKLVKFIEASKNGSVNEINPFDVKVQSWWGDKITNVFAEIKMTNDSGVDAGEFKSVSVDLKPWEETILEGFWNAKEYSGGKYHANITINYEGKKSSAIWDYYLLDATKSNFNTFLNTAKKIILSPITLIVIIALLVAIDLIVIFYKKREKKDEKK